MLPISVAIPTFKRHEELLATIKQIRSCNPLPDEIIVHIDAGDLQTEAILAQSFPDVVILKSQNNVGPGGGRNKCIENAKHNLVASFDDDSFPIDSDYFLELLQTSLQNPHAIVIEAKVYHLNEKIEERKKKLYEQYNFIGCGCAYHKNIFIEVGGYVPKPIAYGLEEVDLSLRAFHKNYMIIHNSQLRVLHNTILKHHSNKKINAGAITNQALLTYLRYPISLYIRGFMQLCNRIIWSIKNRRFHGILKGIMDIPNDIYRYRGFRKTIPSKIIKKYLIKRIERNLINK